MVLQKPADLTWTFPSRAGGHIGVDADRPQLAPLTTAQGIREVGTSSPGCRRQLRGLSILLQREA